MIERIVSTLIAAAAVLLAVAVGLSLRTSRASQATLGHVLERFDVLAMNQPMAPEKLVVRPTLTEDGRVGKVADVQGLVSVKPVMHQRWTPVTTNLLLKPGDWVRTDLRGANAVALRLVPQTNVILGPGSLVEVAKPTQVRLHEIGRAHV